MGFRYFVLGLAARTSLKGWVANEPDGSVKVVAEGQRPALETLIAALRRGPPGARVERVDETWLAATGAFDRFGVRSGAHSGD